MYIDIMVALLILMVVIAALDYYFDILDLLESKDEWNKSRMEYKRWKKQYKRERDNKW